jgi:hypothetical protein
MAGVLVAEHPADSVLAVRLQLQIVTLLMRARVNDAECILAV